MKIRLTSELTSKIPGITVAVLILKNINNLRKNSNVAQLLRGVSASKKQELKIEKNKKKIDGLLAPTLTSGTVLAETHLLESLLRKVVKGTELKSENNALDLAHHLAIKYLTPIQGYDLDEAEKDIEIGFIVPRRGKKALDLNFTKDTKHLALWLVDIGNAPKEDFLKLPGEFTKVLQKYCGGIQEAVYILNADEPETDIHYISEKEKLYLEELVNNPQAIAAKHSSDGSISDASANGDFNEQQSIPDFKTPPSFIPEPLIREQLKEDLAKTVAGLATTFVGEQPPEVETPRERAHGDFSTNIALKLGKSLGKNPREIAETVLKNLPTLPYIEKTEIAGAGFINFYLSKKYLESELQKILQLKEHYGRLSLGAGQKVLIEYSQPNIAKPLGVHHLLSTLIGQTLVNLFRFGGYDVVALNYWGDWGTQFGKLIYAYKTWGNEEQVMQDPLNELLKLYVHFHEEAEKDPNLDDKGREEFKKLEEGDEENKKLWQWIREMSIKEVEKIYKILGIHFDEYLGESMYEEGTKEVLEEGKNKGVFVTGEKGALIVQFENDQYPPYLIQKADGTTLYSTRDLATMKDRILRHHPAKIIYVVDVAQSLHFKQLFATAKKLGIEGSELVHVVFGRMQMPEGKMSTRKGTVILVDVLIKEAETRAAAILAEKNPDLTPQEKEIRTKGIALGAIKYQIISQNRETNLVFDWDRMLALDGNSAPYLQYTYARAKSILRKAKAEIDLNEKEAAQKANNAEIDSAQTTIFDVEAKATGAASPEILEPYAHPCEKELLRMFVKFSEHIELAVKTCKPNVLGNYLYELTQAFNSFYQEVPVISAGTEELKKARLELVTATAQIIKNGLQLLGIPVFEKM